MRCATVMQMRAYRPNTPLWPLYRIYTRQLERDLADSTMPQHVGMIIDGNRRWARQLGHDTVAAGHEAGARKTLEFLGWCERVGIPRVTLYLLSNDNLRSRSADELGPLIDIIQSLARSIAAHEGWCVQHVGSSENLTDSLAHTLREVEQASRAKTDEPTLHVNMAVGYGGRSEIVEAMRRIVRKSADAGEDIAALADRITPELIGEHLYTGGQPDPDLVIRTSGEQRLSDFMLWQSAHSEFYFVEALGPDLREVDFLRALRDFTQRERRFGQ